MTTLIEHSELSVTKNKGKPQVWVGRSKLLLMSGFDVKTTFKITHSEKGEAILDVVNEEFVNEKVNGKVFDHNYTVTGKNGKPIIDLKNLPDEIKDAQMVRVVYLKGRVIITVHSSEKLTKAREADLVKTLENGERVKVASIFSSNKMREQLKRSGLNQIANDITCQLAIEIDKSTLDSAISDNPDCWLTESYAAHGDLTQVDFSQVSIPRVNGLIVDASMFNIRTDKNSGKSRSISADGDHTEIGAILLSIVEIMKRSNPAFINIEVQLPDQSLSKAQYEEQEKAYSTIMTVFSSVINSMGFNIEQDVKCVDDRNLLSLLAISKNLSLEQINRSNLVESVPVENVTPISPKVIQPDGVNHANRVEREKALVENIKGGKSLALASVFSGGGILDRAMHDGLSDMNLNAFCKFGMEWIEAYYLSNLENNHAVWRDESFFLLGDVRHVNVYLRKLCKVNGMFLGIPCIGASRSGLVKNNISCAEEHEIAGALFISAIEIIKAANPAFLIIENVPEYQNTVSMVIIRSVLKVLGYNITEGVLTGNDYGALENRKRLVVVATSKGFGDNSLLDNVPSIVEKQEMLNDIKIETPPSDESWSWRDYLDAKAIADKAKGNNFDQQQLTGEEPKCGTIGRSYQKARSTEPFLIFEQQSLYKKLYESMQVEITVDNVRDALATMDHAIMYVNNASNLINKHNRRNKLKGVDKKISKLALFLNKQVELGFDPIETQFNLNEEMKCNDAIKEEFIATTAAISKATRLLKPVEHAAVKRVPDFLIAGLPATTAHEILGNGVVFSLFQALGRRIGAWIWSFASEQKCFLIKENELQNLDKELFQYHPTEGLLVTSDGVLSSCFEVVKNADGTIYIVPTTREVKDASLSGTLEFSDALKLNAA